MKQNQINLSNNSNNIIDAALNSRIPYLKQTHIDKETRYLNQADFYGNVDSLIIMGGSEKIYKNQNKSRNNEATTICIECRSFSGTAQNINTGQKTFIAGMHYMSSINCYLCPRLGEIDTLTIYLASKNIVLHFNRYFLDILFSEETIWNFVEKIFKTDDKTDTYVIYINYKKFVFLYLQCIANTTFGKAYSLQLQKHENNTFH